MEIKLPSFPHQFSSNYRRVNFLFVSQHQTTKILVHKIVPTLLYVENSNNVRLSLSTNKLIVRWMHRSKKCVYWLAQLTRPNFTIWPTLTGAMSIEERKTDHLLKRHVLKLHFNYCWEERERERERDSSTVWDVIYTGLYTIIPIYVWAEN